MEKYENEIPFVVSYFGLPHSIKDGSGSENDLHFCGRRLCNKRNSALKIPGVKVVKKMKLKHWLGQSTVSCVLFFASVVYRQQLMT